MDFRGIGPSWGVWGVPALTSGGEIPIADKYVSTSVCNHPVRKACAGRHYEVLVVLLSFFPHQKSLDEFARVSPSSPYRGDCVIAVKALLSLGNHQHLEVEEVEEEEEEEEEGREREGGKGKVDS